MKKKVKLFSTIASLCLAVALMAFGVYAATTAGLKLTSTVGFTVDSVYANITVTAHQNNTAASNTAVWTAEFRNYDLTNDVYSQSYSYFKLKGEDDSYSGQYNNDTAYALTSTAFVDNGDAKPTITYKIVVEIVNSVDGKVTIVTTLPTDEGRPVTAVTSGESFSINNEANTTGKAPTAAVVNTGKTLTYLYSIQLDSATAMEGKKGPEFVITITK
ncbi:MAG: hypothetical protein E7376_01330 [Clostridiales bacterium]|nr:hypothetical protein [Clostridiales bacterium]